MQALIQQFIRGRRAIGAATVVLGLSLGGCGMVDGVDLQGGVFDALGVSSAAQDKNRRTETRVAARPGLVLPPGEDRLPQPGAVPEAEPAQLAGGESWPVEPESNKARAKAELEKKHTEYCDGAIRNARIRGETSGVIMGPNGNCQPGLFGSLTGLFEGERK